MQRDPAIDSEGVRNVTRAFTDTQSLEAGADTIIAARVLLGTANNIREGRLSLLGKMKALTESAEEFTKGTETVLDGIAAKIATAKTKRDAAAEKHHGYYDGIIKGVEESVTVIDRLSNGPLPEGGEG
jgi:hypothetical protein